MLVALAMSAALAMLALLSWCVFKLWIGTASEGLEFFCWTSAWIALPIALVHGVIVGTMLTATLWRKPVVLCVHALWWPAALLAVATGWTLGPATAFLTGVTMVVVAIVLAVRVKDAVE